MLLCSSGMARLRVKRFEMIRKIEIERFSLTTSKQFDEVIAGVNAGIGHPDMAEFGRSTHEARSFAELKSAVETGQSLTDQSMLCYNPSQSMDRCSVSR